MTRCKFNCAANDGPPRFATLALCIQEHDKTAAKGFVPLRWSHVRLLVLPAAMYTLFVVLAGVRPHACVFSGWLCRPLATFRACPETGCTTSVLMELSRFGRCTQQITSPP